MKKLLRAVSIILALSLMAGCVLVPVYSFDSLPLTREEWQNV